MPGESAGARSPSYNLKDHAVNLTVNTLGQLEILWNGRPALELRKDRALLVYLALNPGHHERSHLAGLLWGNRPESNARRNLRRALWNLRHHLSADILDGDRLSVGLNPQFPHQVDALDFATHIAVAGRHRLEGNLAAAARRWEKAINAYRGDFLARFDITNCLEFEEWVLRHRARLREMALETLDALISYFGERGEYERALHYARRQLELEPLREGTHRQVMMLLAQTGRRDAAIAQYMACRRLLNKELGLEPLEETTALYRRLAGRQVAKATVAPTSFRPSPALPFTGREDEYATLIKWWEAAIGGKGGLVLVEGEAGVGKTRLVDEVARHVEMQESRVLRGCCYEFGDGLPYQAITEALRDYVHELVTHPSTRSLFRSSASAWLPELARLFPKVRVWRDKGPEATSPPGEAARQRLFEAVARLLTMVHTPLFFFLDDLHWADQSTLDLLHYLVRRLYGAPVLLIGAFRPEEVGAEHPLARLQQGLSRDHLIARLSLKPLSAQAVRKIADSLVEQGDELGDLLYRESEGNPFVLSEVVELLKGEGALPERGDKHEFLVDKARRLTGMMPAGVRAVVLQRVGRLSAASRRLLTIAAAIGRQFDLTLLQAAAGDDAEVVERSLDEWLTRRLVRAVERSCTNSGSAMTPWPSFDFSHDKIRAALYSEVPPGRRCLLHRRIGEALERLHADDRETVCEQLAHHYELGGNSKRALTYLVAAAAKSVATYAHRKAVEYYDRALALMAEDDERRWEILLQRGQSLCFIARYDRAVADYEQVIAKAQSTSPLPARAANEMSALYLAGEEYETAREWSRRAYLLAQASGSQAELARAVQMQGRSEWRLGHVKQARELLLRSLNLYHELQDRHGEAECLHEMAVMAMEQGRPGDALQQLRNALSIYRECGDRENEAACTVAIGSACWRADDNQEAERAFTRGLEIAREIGDRRQEAQALNGLGLVNIVKGDHEKTRQFWEQSAAIYRSLGLDKRAAHMMHNLGIACMDDGDYEMARRYLEKSLESHRNSGASLYVALDLGWLGKLYLRQGDYETARRLLDKALYLDRAVGGSDEEIWHRSWRGEVALEMGDLTTAKELLEEAQLLAERDNATMQLRDVYMQLVNLYIETGRGEDALRIARCAAQMTQNHSPPEKHEQGNCHALLGTVYASGLLADSPDPRPYFERALELIPQNAKFERGVLLRRYAEYLLRVGEQAHAEARLHKAQELLATLGARGELDKVRRLLAQAALSNPTSPGTTK